MSNKRYHWLTILLLAAPAGVLGSMLVEARPAFSGLAMGARGSELELSLATSQPGPVKVVLEDARGRVDMKMDLAQYSEQKFFLPVSPPRDGRVQLQVEQADGSDQARTIHFSMSPIPLLLVSANLPRQHRLPQHPAPGGFRPYIIDPPGMPRTASGYSAVAALVSDQAMLATLDGTQYSALAGYLAGCNILLVHQPGHQILTSLKRIAGCRGRFVEGFRELSELPRLLTSLHSHRPTPGPEVAQLLQLMQPAQTTRRSQGLVFLALAYLLLVILIARRTESAYWLILLPIVTSATMLLAWRGEARPQFLFWAETWSQDEMMRVSSLMQLGNHRRGNHDHCFSDDAVIQADQHAQRLARFEYLPASRQHCVHQFAAWLSGAHLHLHQVKPSPASMRLVVDPAGWPVVSTTNDKAISGARLLWDNRVYTLPVLAPSTNWRPVQGPGSPPTSPQEQLLQQRLADRQPALLVPLTGDPGGRSSLPAGTGWLVIHPDPGALRS